MKMEYRFEPYLEETILDVANKLVIRMVNDTEVQQRVGLVEGTAAFIRGRSRHGHLLLDKSWTYKAIEGGSGTKESVTERKAHQEHRGA